MNKLRWVVCVLVSGWLMTTSLGVASEPTFFEQAAKLFDRGYQIDFQPFRQTRYWEGVCIFKQKPDFRYRSFALMYVDGDPVVGTRYYLDTRLSPVHGDMIFEMRRHIESGVVTPLRVTDNVISFSNMVRSNGVAIEHHVRMTTLNGQDYLLDFWRCAEKNGCVMANDGITYREFEFGPICYFQVAFF